jgi:predicted nuclease of predicted toxin-antitoxin system
MRLLVDECCERSLAEGLRAAGHDAVHVLDLGRRGARDDQIVALARSDNRVLVTDDKDFGDLVVRQRLATAGIVLMRIDPLMPDYRLKALLEALERFGDRLKDHMIVVGPGFVRFRLLAAND